MLRGTAFELAGHGCSPADLEAHVRAGPRPQLVLLDIAPEPEQVARVVAAVRELVDDALIVMLLTDEVWRDAAAWPAWGIDGVVNQDLSLDAMLQALEVVVSNDKLFPAHVVPSILRRPGGDRADGAHSRSVALTERERQVLQHLIDGLPNKMIARELHITVPTVKLHVKNILRKVPARNRTQAAIWAMSHGLKRDAKQDGSSRGSA